MSKKGWVLGTSLLVLGGLCFLLFGEGGIGRFLTPQPYDDPNLINQKWYWQKNLLSDGSEFIPLTGTFKPFLEFKDEPGKTFSSIPNEREYRGTLGCNGITGGYLATKKQDIKVFVYLTTLAGCSNANVNETYWTERASEIYQYRIEADELRFFTKSGEVFIFTRE